MYFDAKEFGMRLKEKRKAAGMTQEELAEKIGLSTKKHISGMECGKEACSIDLLLEIAEVLDVSTDYLLMGKDPGGEALEMNEALKRQAASLAEEMAAFAENLRKCT